MSGDYSDTIQEADALATTPPDEPQAPKPVYGIQETKDLIKMLCRVTNIAVSWKGFDLNVIGSAGFSILPATVQAIDGIGQVPKEAGDIDRAELDEIIALVRDELDLPSDMLETVAAQYIRVAGELSIAVQYTRVYVSEVRARQLAVNALNPKLNAAPAPPAPVKGGTR